MRLFGANETSGGGEPGGGRKKSARFLAELLVVFVGVYGAFWVEGYWQRQEDRERAETILGALAPEIRNLRDNGPLVVNGMSQALTDYEDSRARGERPFPAYYREPGAETPSMSVWTATLSSGGVNLLDSELFFSLAEFYNRVESTSERYIRYNTVTERDVLPLLSRGPGAFYDPLTNELEPRFEVHMDQLRTLRDEVTFIVERADSLHRLVLAELEIIR